MRKPSSKPAPKPTRRSGFTPTELMAAKTLLNVAPVFPYGVNTDLRSPAPAPAPAPAPSPLAPPAPVPGSVPSGLGQFYPGAPDPRLSGGIGHYAAAEAAGLKTNAPESEAYFQKPAPRDWTAPKPRLGLMGNALTPTLTEPAPTVVPSSAFGPASMGPMGPFGPGETSTGRKAVLPEFGGAGTGNADTLPLASPEIPVRDRRGDVKGALLSMLTGAGLGLIGGGGNGALAGAGAAGQGYLQGADTAFNDRMGQYQLEAGDFVRQEQMRQAEAERTRRQANEDRDYQFGVQRQSELDASRLSDDKRQTEQWLSTLTPEAQADWANRNRETLDRLGIGYTPNPDGSVSLPSYLKAAPPARPLDPVTQRLREAQIDATLARARKYAEQSRDPNIGYKLRLFEQAALFARSPLVTDPAAKAAYGAEADRLQADIEAAMAGQPVQSGQMGQAPGAAPVVVPAPAVPGAPITGRAPGRATITETPRPTGAGGMGTAPRGMGLDPNTGQPRPLPVLPGLGGPSPAPAPAPSRGLYESNLASAKSQVQMDADARRAQAARDKATKEAAKAGQKVEDGRNKALIGFRDKLDKMPSQIASAQARLNALKNPGKNKTPDPVAVKEQERAVQTLYRQRRELEDALSLPRTPTPDEETATTVKAVTDFLGRGGFMGPSRPMNPVTNRPIPPQDSKTGRFLPEKQQATPVRQGKQTPRSMQGNPNKPKPVVKPKRTEGTLPGGGKWRILPD